MVFAELMTTMGSASTDPTITCRLSGVCAFGGYLNCIDWGGKTHLLWVASFPGWDSGPSGWRKGLSLSLDCVCDVASCFKLLHRHFRATKDSILELWALLRQVAFDRVFYSSDGKRGLDYDNKDVLAWKGVGRSKPSPKPDYEGYCRLT